MESLEKLKQVLLYKEIAGVNGNGDVLFLKDGTKVKFYMSDNDWCALTYGDWKLLKNFEGVITNVKFKATEEYCGCTVKKLFITIYHNQNEVAQAECYSDNGNDGYYYSVLSVCATGIDGKQIDDFAILEA